MWFNVSYRWRIVNGDFNNDIKIRKSAWSWTVTNGIVNTMLSSLVTFVCALFLTGPVADASTTNMTIVFTPTTITTTTVPLASSGSPSPSADHITNCNSWNDVIAIIRNHPDMIVTCRKNDMCTGIGCKGRYSNPMHAIDYELCFGATFRLCENPVDVFVYFYFPDEQSTYGRAFDQTIRPINLPKTPDGNIQSYMELKLNRSIIQGNAYLHIELTMMGESTTNLTWIPELMVPIVNQVFVLPACNPQMLAPDHISCDDIDRVTTIRSFLPTGNGMSRRPKVTTTMSPAKAYKAIIIVVVVVADAILVGVGIYLYLRYRRRQRARKLYDETHPTEHQHHHHHHDGGPNSPHQGDLTRHGSLHHGDHHGSPYHGEHTHLESTQPYGEHHHHGSPHHSEHGTPHHGEHTQDGSSPHHVGHHRHESTHHRGSQHHSEHHQHGSPHHSGHQHHRLSHHSEHQQHVSPHHSEHHRHSSAHHGDRAHRASQHRVSSHHSQEHHRPSHHEHSAGHRTSQIAIPQHISGSHHDDPRGREHHHSASRTSQHHSSPRRDSRQHSPGHQ